MITLQAPEKFDQKLYDIDKFLDFESKEITTKEDATLVADGMQAIKDHIKYVEDRRKMVNKPFRGVIDFFNAEAKKITRPLERIYEGLKPKLGAWQAEENRIAKEKAEAERKAEQERLAKDRKEAEARAFKTGSNVAAEEATLAAKREENKAKQVVKSQTVMRTENTKISVREDWKFRILDVTQIPHEFLMPNTTKIGAFVRKNKDKAAIPGIETYTAATPIFRK